MQQLKYAVSVTDELVSVNSPIMLRGSFEQCFQDAAECGYDGVELQIKNPGNRNPAQIIELLEKNHLQAAAITTGMEYFGNGLSMIAEDQAVQDQAVIRLIEHVELAQKLNCKVVFGSMRGSIENFSRLSQMEDRLIGNLNKVLDVAVARNVDMVIEPINLYVNNYINSLPEGVKFINRVGADRLGMLIDTHHMRLHDGDMYEAILKSAPYIHYVHYSDSNRYYPGGGNIDFLQCTRALLTAGYQGWITLECLPLEDGKACATKGLHYCRDLEKACDAILSTGD